MELIFQNQVALVTGGSFGIGRAAAIAFAQRGAKVAVADWIKDEENTTLQRINEAGSEGIFIQCDVSKHADVKKLIDQTIATFGRLDCAFNKAGIEGIIAPTHECTEENWDKTIAINLKGVWLGMKYELTHMLLLGKGVIVNCASVVGLTGFKGLPAYVVSKHGLVA